MILALTKDQSVRKRWEAGNGIHHVYSVDGMILTLNPEYDPDYILDEFNPKILVHASIQDAIEWIKNNT